MITNSAPRVTKPATRLGGSKGSRLAGCPRCDGALIAGRERDERAYCLHCGYVAYAQPKAMSAAARAALAAKGKPGRGHSHAQRERVADRRADVARLRLGGAGVKAIARELRVSVAVIKTDIRALERGD